MYVYMYVRMSAYSERVYTWKTPVMCAYVYIQLYYTEREREFVYI